MRGPDDFDRNSDDDEYLTFRGEVFEGLETSMSDGHDYDGDGVTDCDDLDCVVTPTCGEVCNDGVDNDLDGDTDCADQECVISSIESHVSSTCETTCASKPDDDQDCVDDGEEHFTQVVYEEGEPNVCTDEGIPEGDSEA